MIGKATGDQSQTPRPLSEKTFLPLHFRLGEIPENLVVMQETINASGMSCPKPHGSHCRQTVPAC